MKIILTILITLLAGCSGMRVLDAYDVCEKTCELNGAKFLEMRISEENFSCKCLGNPDHPTTNDQTNDAGEIL